MKLSRRSALAAPLLLPALPATAPARGLGIVSNSFALRFSFDPGFKGRETFVSHCRDLGAAGVQLPIGARDDEEADRLRRLADEAGMVLEGMVRPPEPEDPKDLDRFEAELRGASRAGATVVRTAMLSGRRYEAFDSAGDFGRFRGRSLRSLQLAEPMLARYGIRLAVENHKDFRTDEQLDLLKAISSDRVGTCVDLGNNLALLEDPAETVRALAPMAMTSHIKDMGVAEEFDGFLLSEVPLGRGMLDLPALIATLRASRPECRLMLEMLTREPLPIPCLSVGYWSTMADVPGRDLARTLALVREHDKGDPLPRVAHLSPELMIETEEANVRACLAHASRALGL